ncbi:MAG: NFACT family protein [Clostridia bacterium]|nr:NFACT family protein [Clostridia bacterium]
MALDAAAVRALVTELQCLVSGRVDKIHQPERDEIVIHIRTRDDSYKLVISASPAHPRIHLTAQTKKNPKTAPLFCMLLRKHIGSGRITAVEQPGFERVVKLGIESYTELGELTTKQLIVEIMGRHSNIILVDENGRIIDSVKRIDESVSSVREILPGGLYEPPPAQDRQTLIDFSVDDELDLTRPQKAEKALIASVAGISPLTARELIYSVFGTTDVIANQINTNRAAALKLAVIRMGEAVRGGRFSPCMITDNGSGRIIEFSSVDIKQYEGLADITHYDSMNALVDDFYRKRDMHERLRQRSADLTKLLGNNIERLSRKLDILKRTIDDAEKAEEYKIYGDLITANIYCMTDGMTELEAQNFYSETGGTIKIALDPSLSPSQNAQKYYKKYTKAKVAQVEAVKQMKMCRGDLDYIESTLAMAQNAESAEDISAIRAELMREGYVEQRRKETKQRKKETSKPMHFISSDGFDIYVGRNNTQNDQLTLRFANNSDWWFHTKDIHGSHTIIKLGTDKEVPRRTMLEAAQLAAYYSKARESAQVPVDYTRIKNVKKPNGAKPGMVIYEGYNTVYVSPENVLTKCE